MTASGSSFSSSNKVKVRIHINNLTNRKGLVTELQSSFSKNNGDTSGLDPKGPSALILLH